MMIFLTILCGFLWYQVIVHMGISFGIHRYFAHKQFPLPSWVEYVILYLCVLAGARSPIGWISAHRMHHAYSDTNQDPHSPKFKGRWNIFFSQWTIENIPARFSKDLMQNERLMFFHKHWLHIWLLTAVLLFLVGGIYLLLAGIIIPMILSFIAFGCINGLCHTVDGEPINNPWVNILTAGEGYHLAHHENGKAYRLHRYDTTGILIEGLIKIGFIRW